MTARAQAEELVTDYLYEHFNDEPGRVDGWSRDWWRDNLAKPLLDALLAATQEQTCPNPNCDDGRVYYGTDELHWVAKPCPDCSDGVVPGTEPLIILGPEQVGWQWVDDGIADGGLLSLDTPLRSDTRCVAVYRRAGSPDE